MNDAAGRWLEDLGGRADGSDLPIEISAVAIRLRHLPAGEPPMPRRGQLVAAILQRDYLPGVISGHPLGPSGAFVAG